MAGTTGPNVKRARIGEFEGCECTKRGGAKNQGSATSGEERSEGRDDPSILMTTSKKEFLPHPIRDDDVDSEFSRPRTRGSDGICGRACLRLPCFPRGFPLRRPLKSFSIALSTTRRPCTRPSAHRPKLRAAGGKLRPRYSSATVEQGVSVTSLDMRATAPDSNRCSHRRTGVHSRRRKALCSGYE